MRVTPELPGAAPAAVTADEFRDVIGHFASGVGVVTVTHDGRPHGTTANAITSLCVDPPMLLVCMNRASATGQAMSAAGAFAVNILAEDQAPLARRFATKDPEKFTGVGLTAGPHGQPLLPGALAHVECQVEDAVSAGTHTIFIGRVASAGRRPGAPLAYFRGGFRRLASPVEVRGA